ncbi:PREDICTED: protein FAM110C-like [Chrysochloris asiatica]|uniref:Protein FAM110C-like n=1 Tax=Chrysochloris asiatica TaxID=185453 RepID=A0A9B0TS70_CHRAS|nr:PREDICTED: protein FAM110C-like [Chrysochloris asiatica]
MTKLILLCEIDETGNQDRGPKSEREDVRTEAKVDFYGEGHEHAASTELDVLQGLPPYNPQHDRFAGTQYFLPINIRIFKGIFKNKIKTSKDSTLPNVSRVKEQMEAGFRPLEPKNIPSTRNEVLKTKGRQGAAGTRALSTNQREFKSLPTGSRKPAACTKAPRHIGFGAPAAMPAGGYSSVRMHALSAIDAPVSERLLHRGPQYLRQHLDAARPASKSAVERLAADRLKYVKSQPVAGPTGRSSTSESSSESCSLVSRRSAHDTLGGEEKAAGASQPPARAPCPVARRVIARKPLRPDSLVIYRQKCEFVKGPGTDNSRGGLVKKLFQGPGKDKALVAPEMPKVREEVKEAKANDEDTSPRKASVSSLGPSTVTSSVVPQELTALSLSGGAPSRCQAAPPGPELPEVRRRGLHRSQSDISSRYSKSIAEFDTFFQYCGLDPEVVEDLGRENFSAGSDHIAFKVRSVSIATSDSGFSRHSCKEDGLQEEELIEQAPATTSVVEKNARIIKWLYTCKKAKETASKGQ